MRALVSSSALAVNFFDAWRDVSKLALARALGFNSDIAELSFESKTADYPVKPRSPNLDLMLCLAGGTRIAIESKFSEPYRSGEGFGALSARYFPAREQLWTQALLPAAQRVADRLRPEWGHFDAPQVLKHLLGLASDPRKPSRLAYLWFDTGEPGAVAHREEIERFKVLIAGDPLTFVPATYQQVFGALSESDEPAVGWYSHMSRRYFEDAA